MIQWHEALELVDKIVSDLSTPGPRGGERRAGFTLYHNRTQATGFDNETFQAVFWGPGVVKTAMGETATEAILEAAKYLGYEIEEAEDVPVAEV
jgi:hypothetical protein